MFKKLLFLYAIAVIFSANFAFAQKPKVTPKPAAQKIAGDGEAFEKAQAEVDLTKKIAALQKFAANFPKSAYRTRALESAVVTRARLADEKLRAGETEAAVALFKKAVAESPSPVSEKLFLEVILQFPTNLFYGNQIGGALEVAKAIEDKFASDPRKLLGLATFYLATENAGEAKRLAEKVISADSRSVPAYQTLGMAHRINFDLENAEAAYAKALESDANSAVSKRSLAEIKRALGKTDEAAAIYRSMLEKNADDTAAKTGLILTLFDAGKQAEAEAELDRSLAAAPANLSLLTGAAYWYAANNQGAKAVEYAQKALAVEPRYTWAYIALARGYIAQNNPLEAEKTLLSARQFGNFPTLEYEIALARMSAGFFGEAAEILKKDFAVTDGTVETKLGNRVAQKSRNFIELLAGERRASIFTPYSADTAEEAERAESLLVFNQKVFAENIGENELNRAADEFVKGSDKMQTFRLLYAADLLLRQKKNLPKVLELTQASIKGIEESLNADGAASAVLADELLSSRTAALAAGQVIVIPDVPRRTLSSILRGRIEDIFGWTFYQQGKTDEAVVRLKRAVSILPEKSSYWRSSMWRLGTALDASGNTKEALDAYLKSYADGGQDLIRRTVIEAAYRKVNGNLEGLDKLIGAPPEGYVSAQTAVEQTATPSAETATTPPAAESVKPAEIVPVVQETKSETVPPDAPPAAEKPAATKEKDESKPLFEPVIIQVPNRNKTVSETKTELPTCLVVSQETATIINNGGNLGFLIGFNEKNDPSLITAESSSPDDVAVTLEPGVGSLSNRAFFVVKSISEKPGEFKINFKSPCGSKEIKVTVR